MSRFPLSWMFDAALVLLILFPGVIEFLGRRLPSSKRPHPILRAMLFVVVLVGVCYWSTALIVGSPDPLLP